MIIQHNCIYRPRQKAVSSTRNPKTRQAVVTETHHILYIVSNFHVKILHGFQYPTSLSQ